MEDWNLAIKYSTYGFNLEKNWISSDSFRLNILINHCIALKYGNKFEQAKEILNGTDFSSNDLKYKMAKEVILNNNKAAFDLLRKIGPNDDHVNEKAYLSWPLFKELRQDDEFRKLFSTFFKKDLVDQINNNLDKIK